jgi:hypothetical protein
MTLAKPEDNYWRKCSACKRPINFGQIYQVCSVSTCTKKRGGFVFCSVPCWASHVPTFRHRDAWAIEEKAPTREEHLKELARESAGASGMSGGSTVSSSTLPTSSGASASPRKVTVPMASSSSTSGTAVSEDDILIVVSKLKAYIKAKADMNTSGDVMEVLSDRLRRLCDDAIATARSDGRKTVMARDFKSR